MNAPDEPSLRPEWDLQLSRILHEMAGAVSMCWNPRPSGEFESTQAAQFVADAIAEIRSLAQAQEPPALAPDEPSRKRGHSKLVYDKERRTIVAVDPSPALAPDRAKLVKEIDAFMADAPKGHPHTRYRYGELLQRARDMIVSLDKQLWATDKAYQINKNSWEREFKQRCERDDRIAELETALTAATKAPLPEDIEWMHKFVTCTPFGENAPPADIERAHQIVTSLVRALAEAQATLGPAPTDEFTRERLLYLLRLDWDCLPECDSYGHAEGCAFVEGPAQLNQAIKERDEAQAELKKCRYAGFGGVEAMRECRSDLEFARDAHKLATEKLKEAQAKVSIAERDHQYDAQRWRQEFNILEAKCSALEADKRRLDKLEAIITTGWYLDSWSGRPGCAFFTGCDDPPKFSAETVRGALDSALASQPPEGKAKPPYPKFCHTPDKCAGLASCPRDPCCCD